MIEESENYFKMNRFLTVSLVRLPKNMNRPASVPLERDTCEGNLEKENSMYRQTDDNKLPESDLYNYGTGNHVDMDIADEESNQLVEWKESYTERELDSEDKDRVDISQTHEDSYNRTITPCFVVTCHPPKARGTPPLKRMSSTSECHGSFSPVLEDQDGSQSKRPRVGTLEDSICKDMNDKVQEETPKCNILNETTLCTSESDSNTSFNVQPAVNPVVIEEYEIKSPTDQSIVEDKDIRELIVIDGEQYMTENSRIEKQSVDEPESNTHCHSVSSGDDNDLDDIQQTDMNDKESNHSNVVFLQLKASDMTKSETSLLVEELDLLIARSELELQRLYSRRARAVRKLRACEWKAAAKVRKLRESSVNGAERVKVVRFEGESGIMDPPPAHCNTETWRRRYCGTQVIQNLRVLTKPNRKQTKEITTEQPSFHTSPPIQKNSDEEVHTEGNNVSKSAIGDQTNTVLDEAPIRSESSTPIFTSSTDIGNSSLPACQSGPLPAGTIVGPPVAAITKPVPSLTMPILSAVKSMAESKELKQKSSVTQQIQLPERNEERNNSKITDVEILAKKDSAALKEYFVQAHLKDAVKRVSNTWSQRFSAPKIISQSSIVQSPSQLYSLLARPRYQTVKQPYLSQQISVLHSQPSAQHLKAPTAAEHPVDVPDKVQLNVETPNTVPMAEKSNSPPASEGNSCPMSSQRSTPGLVRFANSTVHQENQPTATHTSDLREQCLQTRPNGPLTLTSILSSLNSKGAVRMALPEEQTLKALPPQGFLSEQGQGRTSVPTAQLKPPTSVSLIQQARRTVSQDTEVQATEDMLNQQQVPELSHPPQVSGHILVQSQGIRPVLYQPQPSETVLSTDSESIQTLGLVPVTAESQGDDITSPIMLQQKDSRPVQLLFSVPIANQTQVPATVSLLQRPQGLVSLQPQSVESTGLLTQPKTCGPDLLQTRELLPPQAVRSGSFQPQEPSKAPAELRRVSIQEPGSVAVCQQTMPFAYQQAVTVSQNAMPRPIPITPRPTISPAQAQSNNKSYNTDAEDLVQHINDQAYRMQQQFVKSTQEVAPGGTQGFTACSICCNRALFMCAACQKVWYCSKQCQVNYIKTKCVSLKFYWKN